MASSDYIAPTIVDSGSSAAPGAFSNIAFLLTPPRGTYEVVVTVVLDGTAETQKTNMNFVRDAAVLADLLTITGQVVTTVFHDVELNGSQSLLVQSGAGAATAGSIYNAQIAATRIA